VVAICYPPARPPVRACTPHRQPERYARRRPERTPLYGIVAGHLETWLAERSLGDRPIATYVEEELRAYLRCGILSFGFARARCGTCGQGDLAEKAVAFLPSRPITLGDLDTLTGRVRRRLIRWFRRAGLLDAKAAAG